jgi:hypothetical protein
MLILKRKRKFPNCIPICSLTCVKRGVELNVLLLCESFQEPSELHREVGVLQESDNQGHELNGHGREEMQGTTAPSSSEQDPATSQQRPLFHISPRIADFYV